MTIVLVEPRPITKDPGSAVPQCRREGEGEWMRSLIFPGFSLKPQPTNVNSGLSEGMEVLLLPTRGSFNHSKILWKNHGVYKSGISNGMFNWVNCPFGVLAWGSCTQKRYWKHFPLTPAGYTHVHIHAQSQTLRNTD